MGRLNVLLCEKILFKTDLRSEEGQILLSLWPKCGWKGINANLPRISGPVAERSRAVAKLKFSVLSTPIPSEDVTMVGSLLDGRWNRSPHRFTRLAVRLSCLQVHDTGQVGFIKWKECLWKQLLTWAPEFPQCRRGGANPWSPPGPFAKPLHQAGAGLVESTLLSLWKEVRSWEISSGSNQAVFSPQELFLHL